MKQREFLTISGASISALAAGAGACTRQRRLQERIAPVHDLMAARVAKNEFPGAVWLVAHGDDVAVDTPDFLFSGGRDAFFHGVYAATGATS